MTRATHPDSDCESKAPPPSATNDPLRAERLGTLAALAGKVDLRYTNDELEALEGC